MRNFRNGLNHLSKVCPHMRWAMERYGRPKSRKKSPGFATLIRIIIDQQVSVQAGAAIWARLENNLGIVTPETVISSGEVVLRRSGLSGPKTRYVLGIADAVQTGTLALDRLGRFREEKARSQLIALKGIGEWTADVYLMFALGRPDVWPVGDVALQAAAGNLLKWKERPNQVQLQDIGEAWRPYRSVAAVMLWHYYKKMPAQK